MSACGVVGHEKLPLPGEPQHTSAQQPPPHAFPNQLVSRACRGTSPKERSPKQSCWESHFVLKVAVNRATETKIACRRTYILEYFKQPEVHWSNLDLPQGPDVGAQTEGPGGTTASTAWRAFLIPCQAGSGQTSIPIWGVAKGLCGSKPSCP